MPEVYAWPEASITLYTGSHAPATSAVQAFAKSVNAAMVRGWMNNQTLGSEYYNVLTGQRADVSIAALYTYGAAAIKMIEAATAVHLKLNHTGVNGSAGFYLYSGVFDSLALNGADNGIFQFTMAYHANSWSAF